MSNAYRLAPAGQIGPVNYIAIIFAGIWGFSFWHETPDLFSLIGFALILSCHYFVQSTVTKTPESPLTTLDAAFYSLHINLLKKTPHSELQGAVK